MLSELNTIALGILTAAFTTVFVGILITSTEKVTDLLHASLGLTSTHASGLFACIAVSIVLFDRHAGRTATAIALNEASKSSLPPSPPETGVAPDPTGVAPDPTGHTAGKTEAPR